MEDAFLLLTCWYISVDCTAAAVFYAFSPLASRETPPFLILYYSDVLNGVSYQFSTIPEYYTHRYPKQWRLSTQSRFTSIAAGVDVESSLIFIRATSRVP